MKPETVCNRRIQSGRVRGCHRGTELGLPEPDQGSDHQMGSKPPLSALRAAGGRGGALRDHPPRRHVQSHQHAGDLFLCDGRGLMIDYSRVFCCLVGWLSDKFVWIVGSLVDCSIGWLG